MIRLSAFADEISPDLNGQIATLQHEGIRYLDLRSMWNINVLDLSDAQIGQIKHALDTHEMSVAAIGSPLGKTAIDSPFEATMQKLQRAIEVAQLPVDDGREEVRSAELRRHAPRPSQEKKR